MPLLPSPYIPKQRIEAPPTCFLSSLGVAVGDGAGLGEGELNKSSSSSSKRPEGLSRADLVSLERKIHCISYC